MPQNNPITPQPLETETRFGKSDSALLLATVYCLEQADRSRRKSIDSLAHVIGVRLRSIFDKCLTRLHRSRKKVKILQFVDTPTGIKRDK